MANQNPLVKVVDLKVHFGVRKKFLSRESKIVKAVDGVSLNIFPSETLGLVGESGCGKSTLGKAILNLIKPESGSVFFNDREILSLATSQMRQMRRKMQIIFQDPYASLNPRMTIGNIIKEALDIHKIGNTNEDRLSRVAQLISTVGLRAESIKRYPHEFSGGQRQRIGIARALAVNPMFIVCDEPISALDVSIQAQVVNLLMDLQHDFGLTYLFIAHDLHVVKHIADRIAVMYLGNIVEIGPSEDVYNNPQHPYTKALLSAVPVPNPKKKSKRILLKGEVPSPINPPSGCKFHPRCSYAMPKCKEQSPELQNINTGNSSANVACFLYS